MNKISFLNNVNLRQYNQKQKANTISNNLSLTHITNCSSTGKHLEGLSSIGKTQVSMNNVKFKGNAGSTLAKKVDKYAEAATVTSAGGTGALKGAAIGTVFGGPGIGTAIGGVIGGIAGSVAGELGYKGTKAAGRALVKDFKNCPGGSLCEHRTRYGGRVHH